MTKKLLFIATLIFCQLSYASDKTTLRLGLLAYGTSNWELAFMRQAQQLETETYRLQVIPMANPQAGKIALQSGAVDIIVTDWIWVSYQRSLGQDYTFYPYSNATGALVVAKDSEIKTWQDLKGKRLAIAGGELDKNSLLLQALMQKQGQSKLFQGIEKVYGAPPLLTQQLKQQRVDALLTYWHYAARLEAEGYRVLMTGADILQGLGIEQKVPSIGYVFKRAWAEQHQAVIQAFLQQSKQAKNTLCSVAVAWQSIDKLTHTQSKQEDQLLREQYCAGRVSDWGEEEQQAAGEIYHYLQKISQERLTGKSDVIQAGTFW
ncbi:MAG: ABC transporter substrate-binding protein [Methyloprofundus sp.]|nr:ABC transporter substrate-binding protein [Methyloprofundus sp.]